MKTSEVLGSLPLNPTYVAKFSSYSTRCHRASLGSLTRPTGRDITRSVDAVLDPQSMVVQDLFCCEDAHAQERSLCPQMLASVKPGEVWIADRNFCTRSVLFGIEQRQADFL